MAAMLFFQTPLARADASPLSSPLENQQPETSTYTAPQNLGDTQPEPTTDFLMNAPLSAVTDEEISGFVSEEDVAEILRQANVFDRELDQSMEAAVAVLDGLESELNVKYPENIVSRTVLPGIKEAIGDVERRCEEAMTQLENLSSRYENAGDDEKAELFQSMEAIKQDMDPSNEDTATLGGQMLYNRSEVEYWDTLTKRLIRIWDTASAGYDQISAQVSGLTAQAGELKARFAELSRLHPGTVLEKFVLERVQGLEDMTVKIHEDVAIIETQYRAILASRDANDLERGKLPNFLTAVDKFLNADTLSAYPGEMNYYESEALYMEDLALKFGDSWNLAKSYYDAILAQEPVLNDLQSRLSALRILSGSEAAGLLAEVTEAIQDLQESKQAAQILKMNILSSRDMRSIEFWMSDLEKLGVPYGSDGAAVLQIESLKQSIENLETSTPKPDLKKADPKIRKAAEKAYRSLLRTAHLALRYTAMSEDRVEAWSEMKPSILKSKEYEKYSLSVENVRATMTSMIAEASALLTQINGQFTDPKKAEILLRELKAKDSQLSLYWKKTGKLSLQDNLQKLKKKFRSK